MKLHKVRVFPSKEPIQKEEQLAWKIARVASDDVAVSDSVVEMIINRIIDNAAVACAAINRTPVANARSQALCHPVSNGATVFGVSAEQKFSPEWAAWANGVAVRELDMHDTFLAADYSHPADSIPPILAVAQRCGRSGADLIRALVSAYEVHINLVKGICLHEFKKDHIAHLCPAQVAGIGVLLNLDTETIYQSIQQAVHVSFTTRQSRKGEISSWKAYAPAHSGKLAIEAVDRAMRGERSPSPIYEGEDSVIAYMLDGTREYQVPLPEKGEEKKAILESYTKEHSAEYQSQAFIDLAVKMRGKISDLEEVEKIVIHTSHHTHYVIGTGAQDPQKFDPNASRETLDHSIMYIFSVALQDGGWHHIDSYTPERTSRKDTVALWHKIETQEDPRWTELYHEKDPSKRSFGGWVEIFMKNGETISDEILVANAHPFGARPFTRDQYKNKFQVLTSNIVPDEERARFFSMVEKLPTLNSEQLFELNVVVNQLQASTRDQRGIF